MHLALHCATWKLDSGAGWATARRAAGATCRATVPSTASSACRTSQAPLTTRIGDTRGWPSRRPRSRPTAHQITGPPAAEPGLLLSCFCSVPHSRFPHCPGSSHLPAAGNQSITPTASPRILVASTFDSGVGWATARRAAGATRRATVPSTASFACQTSQAPQTTRIGEADGHHRSRPRPDPAQIIGPPAAESGLLLSWSCSDLHPCSPHRSDALAHQTSRLPATTRPLHSASSRSLPTSSFERPQGP